MSEPNRMRMKFNLPSKPNESVNPLGKANKPVPKPITMKQALTFIDSKGFEPVLKAELIKRISRYPSSSLNVGLQNLKQMIFEINQKIMEESGEEFVPHGARPPAFALIQNTKEESNGKKERTSDSEGTPSNNQPSDAGSIRQAVEGERSSTKPNRRKFQEIDQAEVQEQDKVQEEGDGLDEVKHGS